MLWNIKLFAGQTVNLLLSCSRFRFFVMTYCTTHFPYCVHCYPPKMGTLIAAQVTSLKLWPHQPAIVPWAHALCHEMMKWPCQLYLSMMSLSWGIQRTSTPKPLFIDFLTCTSPLDKTWFLKTCFLWGKQPVGKWGIWSVDNSSSFINSHIVCLRILQNRRNEDCLRASWTTAGDQNAKEIGIFNLQGIVTSSCSTRLLTN